MELFTIGDSISQGFMSLAAARTDLSYSTLIAGILKVDPYHYPGWLHGGGHPVNLEEIFRRLQDRLGSNIKRLEYLRAVWIISRYLDKMENYYERGPGKASLPYQHGNIQYFHNIAVRGFDVADAWLVTPALCIKEINSCKKSGRSNIFGTPSKSFYRTALQVLNPSRNPAFGNFSALDWLDYHHNRNASEKGVKNLILWLGANNVLSTVLYMKVKMTPNSDGQRPHQLDNPTRVNKGWNLWHPVDFRLEYQELINRVDNIMRKNDQADWKVFIGTVPHVTIAPFAKGVGPSYRIKVNGEYRTYFKYYTYVPFEYDFAHESNRKITIDQALFIDTCIDQYNEDIRNILAAKNNTYGTQKYYVVDICDALGRMAVKRNDYQVTYDFPDFFRFQYPPVNTKYYHADYYRKEKKKVLSQGGVFSLDGVHPSAIGHGLLAWEFLKVMDKARNQQWQHMLNWPEIFLSDDLYQDPLPIVSQIYQYDWLATRFVRFVQRFRD
jgi:hypothetical protein